LRTAGLGQKTSKNATFSIEKRVHGSRKKPNVLTSVSVKPKPKKKISRAPTSKKALDCGGRCKN